MYGYAYVCIYYIIYLIMAILLGGEKARNKEKTDFVICIMLDITWSLILKKYVKSTLYYQFVQWAKNKVAFHDGAYLLKQKKNLCTF